MRWLAKLRHQLCQLAAHPVGQHDVRRRVAQRAQQANDRCIRHFGILRFARNAQPRAARCGHLTREPRLAGSGWPVQVHALTTCPCRFNQLLNPGTCNERCDCRHRGSRGSHMRLRVIGCDSVSSRWRIRRCDAELFAQRTGQFVRRLGRLDIELCSQRGDQAFVGLECARAIAERGTQANHFGGGRLVAGIDAPSLRVKCQSSLEIATFLFACSFARQQPCMVQRQFLAPPLQPGIELDVADPVESIQCRTV